MNAPNEFKVRKFNAMVQLQGCKGQKPTLLVQGNMTCLCEQGGTPLQQLA